MILPAVIVVLLLAMLGARAFLARRPPVPAGEHAGTASGVATQPSPLPFSDTSAPIKGTVHGKVAQQVMPNVPQSARNTITGMVKVNAQVSVDPSGHVSEARLILRGPSAYFARRALEAAQQWTFTPAQVDGRAVDSEWTLRFQFSRGGTQAAAAEVRP